MEGIILKALSGFYYVDGGDGVLVACRGRGKFRHQRITPLVGDKVIFTPLDNGAGILDKILPAGTISATGRWPTLISS